MRFHACCSPTSASVAQLRPAHICNPWLRNHMREMRLSIRIRPQNSTVTTDLRRHEKHFPKRTPSRIFSTLRTPKAKAATLPQLRAVLGSGAQDSSRTIVRYRLLNPIPVHVLLTWHYHRTRNCLDQLHLIYRRTNFIRALWGNKLESAVSVQETSRGRRMARILESLAPQLQCATMRWSASRPEHESLGIAKV